METLFRFERHHRSGMKGKRKLRPEPSRRKWSVVHGMLETEELVETNTGVGTVHVK